MEQFYVIVITIAIVLLILALTYIGVFLIGDDTTQVTFPPHSNQCPDYWEVNGDGACIVPTNNINKPDPNRYHCQSYIDRYSDLQLAFGKSCENEDTKNAARTHYFTQGFKDWDGKGRIPGITEGSFDFKDKPICEKKQWANNYGVIWDGVTNYNKC